MDALTALALGFAMLAAGAVGFILWSILRDSDHKSDTPADAARLAECERRLDSLFALRAEWTTYQEIIDDALQAVEVKRRRAAASASKAGVRTEATQEELAKAASILQPEAAPDPHDRLALRRAAVKAGRL